MCLLDVSPVFIQRNNAPREQIVRNLNIEATFNDKSSYSFRIEKEHSDIMYVHARLVYKLLRTPNSFNYPNLPALDINVLPVEGLAVHEHVCTPKIPT